MVPIHSIFAKIGFYLLQTNLIEVPNLRKYFIHRYVFYMWKLIKLLQNTYEEYIEYKQILGQILANYIPNISE